MSITQPGSRRQRQHSSISIGENTETLDLSGSQISSSSIRQLSINIIYGRSQDNTIIKSHKQESKLHTHIFTIGYCLNLSSRFRNPSWSFPSCISYLLMLVVPMLKRCLSSCQGRRSPTSQCDLIIRWPWKDNVVCLLRFVLAREHWFRCRASIFGSRLGCRCHRVQSSRSHPLQVLVLVVGYCYMPMSTWFTDLDDLSLHQDIVGCLVLLDVSYAVRYHLNNRTVIHETNMNGGSAAVQPMVLSLLNFWTNRQNQRLVGKGENDVLVEFIIRVGPKSPYGMRFPRKASIS